MSCATGPCIVDGSNTRPCIVDGSNPARVEAQNSTTSKQRLLGPFDPFASPPPISLVNTENEADTDSTDSSVNEYTDITTWHLPLTANPHASSKPQPTKPRPTRTALRIHTTGLSPQPSQDPAVNALTTSLASLSIESRLAPRKQRNQSPATPQSKRVEDWEPFAPRKQRNSPPASSPRKQADVWEEIPLQERQRGVGAEWDVISEREISSDEFEMVDWNVEDRETGWEQEWASESETVSEEFETVNAVPKYLPVQPTSKTQKSREQVKKVVLGVGEQVLGLRRNEELLKQKEGCRAAVKKLREEIQEDQRKIMALIAARETKVKTGQAPRAMEMNKAICVLNGGTEWTQKTTKGTEKRAISTRVVENRLGPHEIVVPSNSKSSSKIGSLPTDGDSIVLARMNSRASVAVGLADYFQRPKAEARSSIEEIQPQKIPSSEDQKVMDGGKSNSKEPICTPHPSIYDELPRNFINNLKSGYIPGQQVSKQQMLEQQSPRQQSPGNPGNHYPPSFSLYQHDQAGQAPRPRHVPSSDALRMYSVSRGSRSATAGRLQYSGNMPSSALSNERQRSESMSTQFDASYDSYHYYPGTPNMHMS